VSHSSRAERGQVMRDRRMQAGSRSERLASAGLAWLQRRPLAPPAGARVRQDRDESESSVPSVLSVV